MTDKERKQRSVKIRKVFKRRYEKEGPEKTIAVLKKNGIILSRDRVIHIASELKLKYVDPREAQLTRAAVEKHYESLGSRGVQEHLKNAHNIEVSIDRIKEIASELRIKYERGNAQEEPLEGKLRDLIAQGELVKAKDDPVAELHERLRKEAAAANIAPKFLANRDAFREKVFEIVWDKKTLEALEKVMRRENMSLETFTKYHSHIPQKFVEAKARELRGVSGAKNPAEFMRGIGRITDISKIDPKSVVRFERTSTNEPYQSGVTNSRWTASVVNGANIGIKHSPLIEENQVRCSLANAQRRGDALVVLANLIDLDFKKAGGTPQVYRSQISGHNTNIEILAKSYQARARAIEQGLEEGLIYEVAAEKFLNMISGWAKICKRPDGKPEFEGPVLILLGAKEDEFVKAATYWELRYKTLLRQKDLEVELSLANKEIKEAKEDGASKTEIAELIENRDNIAEELSRTKVSHHRREDIEDCERRIRTFVVRKLEEAIPNSKVIGQGSTYVKIGDETVLFEIPSHTRVTDELLANFADHYGPRVLRREIPKTVVICHPHSLNFRKTTREVDSQGRRGSARIYVAPVAIDERYLRRELDQTVKAVHPLEHAIWSDQFQAGTLELDCVQGKVNANSFTVGAHIKAEVGHGIYSKNRSSPRDHYIWTMLPSDHHWGEGWKEFVHDPDDGRDLGMCEAVIEMMRRSKLLEGGKLPLHFFAVPDDPSHGNHFETHKQPHQHKAPFHKIEARFLEACKNAARADAAQCREIIRDMRRFALYQFQVRGEHWTQDQLEQVVERHLEPNVDFFDALLQRAILAKIILKPASEFNDPDHFPEGTPDARDLGLINYSTGNHFLKTVEKTVTEGWIYAKMLRLMLRARPQWVDKGELLEKLIVAPLYGNITVGWGHISIDGGYPWGVEIRNKPPKISSWGDTLLGAVRNDERRGNYSRIFDGHVTLKVYGDKHFDGMVQTGHTIYKMAAPGVPTSVYGELGFPPNNTGVSFVGLPVSGPDGGPVLDRTLSFDQIRDYFRKPYDFDWAEFLPNPA